MTTTRTIAVVGATGTVGRLIADDLGRAGADVRALSRSSTTHPVDLLTGEGLAAALAGCDVVVDAANGDPSDPEALFVGGTGRMLRAAREAGVGHVVCVSIVGLGSIPMRYHRAKLAQEELTRTAGVPWTIVRATQFHELVAGTLSVAAKRGIVLRSRGVLQPVAASEAAAEVASVALGAPQERTLQVSGPEVRTVSALARDWARSGGVHRLPVPLPLPPRFGRPLRAGGLTCDDPDVTGEVTFGAWLTTS